MIKPTKSALIRSDAEIFTKKIFPFIHGTNSKKGNILKQNAGQYGTQLADTCDANLEHRSGARHL